MNYKEAAKAVAAEKPKDNYLLIRMSYSIQILLPYKEGMAFIGALNLAESFTSEYGKPSRIIPFDRENLTITIMSSKEYQRHKIAALLGISVGDLVEFHEEKEKAEA